VTCRDPGDISGKIRCAGSFPIRYFVEISQADAALMNTALSLLAIPALAILLPQSEFVVRERLEEFRPDTELTPHCPEFSFAFAEDWDQLSDRCFVTSDRDDLPSLCSRDKLRQMSLGGVNRVMSSMGHLSLVM
jgi:hypothetical protein